MSRGLGEKILERLLAWFARRTLWRYRPTIVGVTGSVGKTSTKEAIFSVLGARYRVRRSEKNYNTEIGVPLTVLGVPHYGRNIAAWCGAFLRAGIRLIVTDPSYPEMLILEMGADRPGDITYLTALTSPLVGVVTAIGDVPVHVEFFKNPEALAREKSKLVEALPLEGYAVLNFDDSAVIDMRRHTQARVLSYGIGPDSDVRVTDVRLNIKHKEGRAWCDGIRFSLQHGGQVVRVELKNSFGKQQAAAAAAAAAVGLVFNMGLSEIAQAVRSYESPPGRLKLLKGNKQTWILDDTYNASPASTRAALEVLREFPAKRRIAVLGDMLELGTYTEAAHQAIGDRVAEVADLFIAVGERMKFAFDESMTAGVELRRELTREHAFWFPRSEEAGRKLEELLAPGDVVLVKGSQGMRMEKVVKEVMAEPERARELLVRQSAEWRDRT